MTAERRAILLLLGLALAGQGLRYLVTRPGAPGDIQLFGNAPAASAKAHAAAAESLAGPLRPGERVDVDRASARELARLPRVGPSLAQRIVAYRDSAGPFGTLEGLDRVSGIGPGLLRSLAPHVRFSGIPRAGVSGAPPGLSGPSGSSRVNLNTASAEELQRLPLIGPSRAIAIVEWRRRHGSFKNLDDLVLVPGVSRRMADAIRDRVAF